MTELVANLVIIYFVNLKTSTKISHRKALTFGKNASRATGVSLACWSQYCFKVTSVGHFVFHNKITVSQRKCSPGSFHGHILFYEIDLRFQMMVVNVRKHKISFCLFYYLYFLKLLTYQNIFRNFGRYLNLHIFK